METPAGIVPVQVEGPRDAAAYVFLANGAGAPLTSPFQTHMAQRLAEAELRVCRFDFAYQAAGRRSPDRLPVAVATYAAVVRACAPADAAVFLGGKSFGGRVASHVVAERAAECRGVYFFGYPLHPPGKPDKLRDSHLYEVQVPLLFIEGTRDPFCPLDTLERVRQKIPTRTDLVVIEGGDHSFKVTRSSGRTTQAAWDEAAGALVRWINEH